MDDLVGIPTGKRPLGTYICGNPGSGKSSLLQRMILRDIDDNRAVCVIDPTNQISKIVLDYIPKEHLDRVVYFNTSMNVPIDFFSSRDNDEMQELSNDITNIIDLSTAPVGRNYLRRIIRTFFEANASDHPKLDRPCTLFDVPRFIQDQEWMEKILFHCHPDRRYNFPPHIKIQSDSISAILIRMSEITDSVMLKSVLGNPAAKLNVSDLIDQNKIFLVDLRENNPEDAIIGSIIAAKLQQAIFRRRDLPDLYACEPYFLYIDECDVILKFAEERFAAILGRARKYKLCMTIASPLPSELPDLILKGIGKIGSLVLFNLDGPDARIFKSKIAPHSPDELTNLPEYNALFRADNKLQFVDTPHFLPPRPSGNAKYVKDRMLRDYGPEACKSASVSHTSGDGTKPDPARTLPHDAGKAPDTPAPQPVLRPDDKQARRSPKKQDSH
jgi:GTPase SAR1 family protein